MKTKVIPILILFGIGNAATLHGSHAGIRVDGDFSDWHARPQLLHLDPSGDAAPGGIDFTAVGGYMSARGLAIYIRAAEPFRLATSQVRISLDTDGDAETGRPFLGLGIDLEIDFRQEPGDPRFYPAQAVYTNGPTVAVAAVVTDILPSGLNNISTHPESAEYELLIPVSMLPAVTPGGRIGIHVRDGNTGDFIPDIGTTHHIDVPEGLLTENDFTTLDRRHPGDIRIASYNVYHEGPWRGDNRGIPGGEEDKFIRQLVATQPDIIAFQEMWSTTPATVRAFLDEQLPLEEGSWHVVKNRTGSQDCITASRFPVTHVWDHSNRFTAALIDTRDVLGFQSLIINAHTRAHVENQARRILETDNFMLLARNIMRGNDANSPVGEIGLFIVGDLNANAPKTELTAARTGRFTQPALRSLDYAPDRHGLPLADAAPRHTHRRSLATWKSITTSNTQRLDYILYPQSRVTLKRAYTIDTTSMPLDFRQPYNLVRTDSDTSDHLLMIADFAPRRIDYAWEAEDPVVTDWFHSRWLGSVHIYGGDFYYSRRHGHVYAHAGESGVWVHNQDLGWWHSNALAYPFAYRNDTRDWIYFRPADDVGAKVSAYFDFSANEWIPLPATPPPP
ncbi:MAG: endonuclease/exonuclease/phosphatase family protein [Opitutales bacterium]|nr:endonuclease/exonuclease/phosphatase family protein [Opitutales bacterium]